MALKFPDLNATDEWFVVTDIVWEKEAILQMVSASMTCEIEKSSLAAVGFPEEITYGATNTIAGSIFVDEEVALAIDREVASIAQNFAQLLSVVNRPSEGFDLLVFVAVNSDDRSAAIASHRSSPRL